jgi:septal ring factor EnvC (AmiA/AmiB activator)
MPGEDTHALKVQLATALRERDDAQAQEAYWHARATEARDEAEREKAMRWELEKERGEVNAALKAEMAEAEKLRAEVKRLREALEKIRGWSVPGSIAESTATAALCTGGDRGA